MGKGKKEAISNTKELDKGSKTEYDAIQAGTQARQDALAKQNASSREELAGLYRGMGQNGQISAGQVDTGRLGNVYDAGMAFGANGGFSPEREASIMENVGGLKEMGRTGGMTEADANRFRANGTFEEFNTTGGYTDADKSRIRQVSLAPIAGYASQTQDELNRRQAVQGGYGPGFDSAARALRRDTAKGMYEAGMASEMNIKDAVNSGRQWGARGMSDSENAYQTLKTGNQYKGLMGAADVETTLQDTISKYRMAGYSLAQASAAAIADVDMGNVTNKMNADQWNAKQGLAGIEGLAGLYDKDWTANQNDLNRAGGLIDSEYGTRTGINSQLNELLMAPGMAEKLAMAGISSFAGAAGGALTGGVGTALNVGSKVARGAANNYMSANEGTGYGR